MADELRKCPLCQGEGKFRASDIPALLSNPELRREIEGYLAESATLIPAGATIGKGPADRNFDKEVHHWNPQMPIWRRSNKE